MAEQDAAERTHEKGSGENGESGEQRSNLVGGGREVSNGFGAVPADIILFRLAFRIVAVAMMIGPRTSCATPRTVHEAVRP